MLPLPALAGQAILRPMPSKADTLARRFCAALAEDTAGQPMQYRVIATIMSRVRIRDERDQRAAIAYAAAWLRVAKAYLDCKGAACGIGRSGEVTDRAAAIEARAEVVSIDGKGGWFD